MSYQKTFDTVILYTRMITLRNNHEVQLDCKKMSKERRSYALKNPDFPFYDFSKHASNKAAPM